MGIDGFGGRLVDRPNGDDAAVPDADVADERRRTAAVDDVSAPNTEIKHHVHLVLDYVRQYITGRVPPKFGPVAQRLPRQETLEVLAEQVIDRLDVAVDRRRTVR